MRLVRPVAVLLAASLVIVGCGLSLNPSDLPVQNVIIGSAASNYSFNDMEYDAGLKTLVVGGDDAGQLALLDPQTSAVRYISVASQADITAGKASRITSAIVAHGIIYAVEKATQNMVAVDPSNNSVLASVPVKSPADYIRFATARNELWLTEPNDQQIEVFSLANGPIPAPSDVISVPDGPEALVIDNATGLAYTNQATTGKTAVIQVQTHGIISEWGNGCSSGRGMALDPDHSLLFVACKEGKVVVLDTTQDGQVITSQTYGGGLDDIAYNRQLHHLYVASGSNSLLAIFGLENVPIPTPAPTGTDTPGPASGPAPTATDTATPGPTPTPGPTFSIQLIRLGTADTTTKAKCLAADDTDNVWVCNTSVSQLFHVKDTFAASSPEW